MPMGPPSAPPPPPVSPDQGGNGQGPAKVKVDINVELLMIKKLLAKIVDALGIHVPASDLAITGDDVRQLAQSQQSSPPGASSAPGLTL